MPTAQLNLEIKGTSGSCIYGNLVEFGVKNFNYSAQIYSTGFLSTSGAIWSCNDTEGKAFWNVTLQSNTIDHNNTVTRDIPATRVFVKNPAATKVDGACTPYIGDSAGVRKPLSGSVTLFGKASALGEVCSIETSSITIEVDALENQAVGLYSGTLTLSIPLP
ncbi:MAG: hypothetical protein WCJ45_04835 [bacterium]